MKEEFRAELVQHILPFWMRLTDSTNGGFFGYMDYNLKLDPRADKGCILNSRILWTFSNACLVLRDRSYVRYAKHAYEFLRDRFFDRERGGVYWSVNYRGEPKDTTKHAYNIAFAIYALSSYYEVCKESEVINLARELFWLLETKYRDEYGYREALTVDFRPESNEHLSENGVMAAKTMNTTLHIFEAYTELYRVSGFSVAKDSMKQILRLFREKIYNPDQNRLEVFFDNEMNSILDLHSYGHDIEASWLLERGLDVLGDPQETEKTEPILSALAERIYEVAYDGESLPTECEKGKVLQTRVWWVMCEAIIGFYNAGQKKRREEKYTIAAENIWEFTKKHFIDSREGGEWYNELTPDKEPKQDMPIVSEWKCPYHNSRLCLEMLKRINEFERVPVNKNATPKAVRLLEMLADTAGNAIITGQHTQTVPMEERDYLYRITGHKPKLVGFELLSYSPNINYSDASEECLNEVRDNRGTPETALALCKSEAIIPVFCFHWFSPLFGRDKAFYTENTTFDATKILEEGTPERAAFYSDLDVIAELLSKFEKEDIPILWRPFHEAEGKWFWWGARGGMVAAELYRMMFRYFVTEKHLNNILWVWSTPSREAYPGDEYVDIVGWDIYLPEKQATDYAEQYRILRENTTQSKVAALTEVGINPDIAMLEKSRVPWAYYMTWSHEFAMDGVKNTQEELITMYQSDYSVKI